RPLEMLPAIRANPDISFVMVLNRSDDEVQQQVTNAGLGNLTIIPQVTTAQMAALMKASTIFATSSNPAFEGLPSVLLQAAASQKPIVSLETSAEWLTVSGAGVCQHGDLEAFANTIAHFVAGRDLPEIRQYGFCGRKYVECEHDARGQAVKMLEF